MAIKMWVRAFTGIHSESQMPQLPNEQMSKDSNSTQLKFIENGSRMAKRIQYIKQIKW